MFFAQISKCFCRKTTQISKFSDILHKSQNVFTEKQHKSQNVSRLTAVFRIMMQFYIKCQKCAGLDMLKMSGVRRFGCKYAYCIAIIRVLFCQRDVRRQ